MKTFVSDDYQVSLLDDGSFEVRIKGFLCDDTRVKYNPNNKKEYTWTRGNGSVFSTYETYKTSQNLSGLWLSTSKLRTLHKALEVIGRQDLMDDEIVFVDKEEEDGNEL